MKHQKNTKKKPKPKAKPISNKGAAPPRFWFSQAAAHHPLPAILPWPPAIPNRSSSPLSCSLLQPSPHLTSTGQPLLSPSRCRSLSITAVSFHYSSSRATSLTDPNRSVAPSSPAPSTFLLLLALSADHRSFLSRPTQLQRAPHSSSRSPVHSLLPPKDPAAADRSSFPHGPRSVCRSSLLCSSSRSLHRPGDLLPISTKPADRTKSSSPTAGQTQQKHNCRQPPPENREEGETKRKH